MNGRRGAFARLCRGGAVGAVLILVVVFTPAAGVSGTTAGVQATTATGGVTYVTKTYTLGRGKWATFKAACPSTMHVLGGGHWNNGIFTNVIAAHSYPYDGSDADTKPDDGWAADLGGFGGSWQVTMYAECAKVLPAYFATSRTIQPRDSGGLSVSCPAANPTRLSVGSRGLRTLQELLTEVESSGVGFIVATNLDNESRTLTAIAVCSTLDVAITTGTSTAGARTQANLIAPCPPEEPIAIGGGGGLGGGGFTDQPFATGVIAAARPVAARDGWQVWVDNFDSSAHEFEAQAACIAPLQ